MTTLTTAHQESRRHALREPSVWRLCLVRGGVELHQFFRDRNAVIFVLALPVALLLLLGSIFNRQMSASGIPTSQLLAASMIAGGIGSTCYVNVATSITSDRDVGTLKRLRGVPMPPIAYFAGKIILVVLTALAEVAMLLAVGAICNDLPVPTDVGRWVTFTWVFVLGMTACALLGTAISSATRSMRGVAPIVDLPFLILQFISGVYIVPFTTLPKIVQLFGAVFPLKWMAQGFRSVFLPDSAAAAEAAGAWEHGRIALILGAWCLAGLVLCLVTFRWQRREAG